MGNRQALLEEEEVENILVRKQGILYICSMIGLPLSLHLSSFQSDQSVSDIIGSKVASTSSWGAVD